MNLIGRFLSDSQNRDLPTESSQFSLGRPAFFGITRRNLLFLGLPHELSAPEADWSERYDPQEDQKISQAFR